MAEGCEPLRRWYISPGQQLLSELPIASMQLPDNCATVRVCGFCVRACGTISGQLQHASNLKCAPTLPFADDADDHISDVIVDVEEND